MKSSEFHRSILKKGKKRGWHIAQEPGNGSSHYIYEDLNGVRYPVPFHGSKEIPEGLRKRICKDMELD